MAQRGERLLDNGTRSKFGTKTSADGNMEEKSGRPGVDSACRPQIPGIKLIMISAAMAMRMTTQISIMIFF
ncbi:unnamed protein product [Heligmosomoides polygyrus]|uniref:Uncharacterized protein n=1 Tax=Heligmosomoides polygyrus TaxID=6339 RepID=A0A183FM80_HELPZ|nr:unnamed protein product [Heligmosomoides polygyrus]